jgi:peptide/nickel transport system substrate-binding protein
LLLAALVAACTRAPERAPVAAKNALTIGAPEGNAASPDTGLAQIARMLTTDGLTQLTVDGRPESRLAKSWRWDGPQLLRVDLQEGITFHDGTLLDSKRAATILTAAIERNSALYPSFKYVTSVEPAGQYSLVFRLSEPSTFLPEDLEIPLELPPPARGTGPFRITKESPEEIVLEAFSDYRGGRPTVGSITIRPFQTLRTAWASLLRSQVDMVTDVPPDAVEFMGSRDVQVISFARRYQFLVGFNADNPILSSPRVRRALNFAVDREALVKDVLKGRGTTSTGPIWPLYWGYDASVTPYPYDPGMAEMLLDEAGFKRGGRRPVPAKANTRFTFTCLIPAELSVWERIALRVQKDLYAVGVDLQFKVVPVRDFVRILGKGTLTDAGVDALFIDMISGPTPERAYIFWQSPQKSSGLNKFGYQNLSMERAFDLLRTSSNEAAVRSATRGLQRTFLDDPPALFLAWNERARAVRRDFVIPDESGRDPLLTLWRWSPSPPQVALR